jgi:hypothetical protein
MQWDGLTEKTCCVCERLLPIDAFSNTARGPASCCKECNRQKQAERRGNFGPDEWARHHDIAVRNRAERMVRDAKRFLCSVMLEAAKSRAKRFQVPFALTLDDLLPLAVDNRPALEIRLIYEGRTTPDGSQPRVVAGSPSVDRIIPQLAYVRGNVVTISRRANRIKGPLEPQQLRKLADWRRAAQPTDQIER